MEFNAAVKEDSAGQLRGGVRCEVTRSGLAITHRKSGTVNVPIGSGAVHDGGNAVAIDAGGRRLKLVVNKFGSYQGRLAQDVAAFVRGERPAPELAGYKIEPYLLAPAVLPFGIMIVTRGGALWGAIGGALAMLCLFIAQNERMPKSARLGIILLINAVAYGGVIALMAAAPRPDVAR